MSGKMFYKGMLSNQKKKADAGVNDRLVVSRAGQGSKIEGSGKWEVGGKNGWVRGGK